MPLPSATGGFQQNQGNPNEVLLRRTNITALAGAAIVVSPQQLAHMLSVAPANAGTITSPSAAAIDAEVSNANVGHSFDVTFTTSNTADWTFAPGAGVTIVGKAAVTAADSGATFRFVKTGVALWSAFRV